MPKTLLFAHLMKMGSLRKESILDTSSPDICNRALSKVHFILKIEPMVDGVDQIEPLFVDLVEYLQEHPQCRDSVSGEFVKLLSTLPNGYVDLLQFCMHILKWGEIREAASECMHSERGINRKRSYERILESFDAEWVDKDLYDRFVK